MFYYVEKIANTLKKRSKELKKEVAALYLACKRKDVPWYVKAVVTAVVAYALSPVDLIPDFIPVLGYLDDLIILPLSILLAIKLIPAEIMAECRSQAGDLFKDEKVLKEGGD
ncbi:MAG: YkvA family protein [Caldicoprobacter oshimai]